MIKFLCILFIGTGVYAQTVTTYFSNPNISIDDGLVFDSLGNLYGSHYNGDSVYKITPEGEVSLFATGLTTPNGLAFDENDNLYIVNSSANGEIKKYDSSGNLLDTFSVGSFPSGIIKDVNSDDMIFTGAATNSINRLSQDGTITTMYEGDPLNWPIGLAFDAQDSLYVGNFFGREIHRISPNNVPEYVATIPNESSTDDPLLAFITFGNGALWGTSYLGHKIYKINPNGIDDVTRFAGDELGETDGDISNASFSFPNGIVFNDSENAMYISQFNTDGNIRKISNIPLSINTFDELALQVSVAPNPASDYVTIAGDSKAFIGAIKVSVYDISGKLIEDLSKNSLERNFSTTLDISKYTSGVYFLKIHAKSGQALSRRFIKK